MLLITAIALALLGAPAVQTDEDEPAAGARVASSTPSRAISARAASLPDGPTRTVCRRERSMDSNIQRRVCREVALNTAGRERMAGDYVRQMQSIGLNSEHGPRPRAPGGRPVG